MPRNRVMHGFIRLRDITSLVQIEWKEYGTLDGDGVFLGICWVEGYLACCQSGTREGTRNWQRLYDLGFGV